jgi:hypothetical protein
LTTGQNQSEGDKVCPSLSVVLPLSDVNFLLHELNELEQQLLNDDEERSKKLLEKQELSDNLVRELDRQKEAYSTLMKKVIVKVNCSISSCFISGTCHVTLVKNQEVKFLL